MKGPTEVLADYIVKTKIEDFPDEVITKGKQCIANAIGCALGSAQTELGKRHILFTKDLGGRPDATIIGDGGKTSSVFATHVNAELTNAMDFDDNHWYTLSHPSGAIVSSAFAIGELVNATAKEVLTAVVVGYEVGLRIAHAIRSVTITPQGKEEVVSNPSYVVFAAAAAAGKVLGLSAAELINAFGLAGATPINRGQSRVHIANIGHPYTENKYNMGMYALLGVFSSLRGRRIAGPKGILDDDRFWKNCGALNCNHAELTKDLGKEYRIMEMAFKPVCFCGCVDAPVTAVREALKGEKLNPEEVEEIILTGIPKLEFFQWDSMIEAEFSTPCAIALAVTGYEPGPDWYNTGRYKDKDILKLAKKVRQVEDAGARRLAVDKGQWTSTAEIRTKDGKIRKAHIEHEKGTPENPLTEDESYQKFANNANGILGKARANHLWEKLLNLEKQGKIRYITSKLSAP